MTENIPMMVISEEEYQRLAELAQRRGFDGVEDYLRSLVAADAAQHNDPIPFDEEVLATRFKRAFHDALDNKSLTESEFLDALDNDE